MKNWFGSSKSMNFAAILQMVIDSSKEGVNFGSIVSDDDTVMHAHLQHMDPKIIIIKANYPPGCQNQNFWQNHPTE